MIGVLNRKISTEIGIIVLLLISMFVGWMILRQYKEIVKIRFGPIKTEILEEGKNN